MSDDKVLVLGAGGMLGNAVLRFLASSKAHAVSGTVRSRQSLRLLPENLHRNIISGVDVENMDSLMSLFVKLRPKIVVNCIGLVKQINESNDPLAALPINSILPHRLAKLCSATGARLIHMSTDCVFSGLKGMYVEADTSDADDLYGRSKYLGEVDYPSAITLRTSIIGHELDGARSLVGWFLAQEGPVSGYKRAVFSGLPTVEIARIILEFVIPRPELSGLYHVSAEPINKHDLLSLVAQVYGKIIEIKPDDRVIIDRSLDSSRFRNATGFVPKSWPEMVRLMHAFG